MVFVFHILEVVADFHDIYWLGVMLLAVTLALFFILLQSIITLGDGGTLGSKVQK
jgi:hypothetical protein